MNDVIEFVINNWRDIFLCILGIVNLCLILFRKKVKVVDSLYTSLCEYIPEAINWSESLGGSSSEKLNNAKAFIYALGLKLCDSTLDDLTLRYDKRLSEDIEKVLSTPTKKGGSL